jgi:hypothetical protein
MGCFDSVCAFTRTAVHVGDEVLLVLLNPLALNEENTYHLLQGIATYEEDKRYFPQKVAAIITRYERRGIEVTQEMRDETERDNTPKNPFRFFGFGVYDDYGSIEGCDNGQGLEDRHDWWNYQFFVHKSVVLSLLEDPTLTHEDLTEDHIVRLAQIAYRARVQLFGNHLLGAQYYDRYEIILQKKIIQLTTEILDGSSRQRLFHPDYD